MSNEVVFCKTRYQDIGYHSYSDYFKLVELAGYPIIYIDELDPGSDNTYIVTPINGEWQHWPKGYARARLILYQLEHNVDGNHVTPAAVSEVWAGDKWQAETNGFRYVPLGGHGALKLWTNSIPKTMDVSLLSYQVNRRQVITNELKSMGLRVAPPEDVWGQDRSIALCASEVMLHVHQWDNIPSIAPLRWCLAAAHGLPMISETIADRGIFGYTHMMQADYAHLPQFVSYILKDKRLLADYAAALHHLLCHDWTFKRMIEASV